MSSHAVDLTGLDSDSDSEDGVSLLTPARPSVARALFDSDEEEEEARQTSKRPAPDDNTASESPRKRARPLPPSAIKQVTHPRDDDYLMDAPPFKVGSTLATRVALLTRVVKLRATHKFRGVDGTSEINNVYLVDVHLAGERALRRAVLKTKVGKRELEFHRKVAAIPDLAAYTVPLYDAHESDKHTHDLLLMAYVPYTLALHWPRLDTVQVRAVIQAVRWFAQRLVANGIRNEDFHSRNILFDMDTDGCVTAIQMCDFANCVDVDVSVKKVAKAADVMAEGLLYEFARNVLRQAARGFTEYCFLVDFFRAYGVLNAASANKEGSNSTWLTRLVNWLLLEKD